MLERRGLLIADAADPHLEFENGSSLDQIQAASIAYRIAIGPHAGRKALTLYSLPPLEEAPSIPLLATMYGFSLHAGTVCEVHQRSKLERLCRYITRPPIATKRLSVDEHGRVLYRYKRPFRDGSTHVVLEPLPTCELSQFRSWPEAESLGSQRFESALHPTAELESEPISESRCSPYGQKRKLSQNCPSWISRLIKHVCCDFPATFFFYPYDQIVAFNF